MQPYTRRSRSSSSLPTHPPRVTSTLPNHDQQEKENTTTHAIEEAIACTSFPIQHKKKTVAKSDVDKLNGMLQVSRKKKKNAMHKKGHHAAESEMNGSWHHHGKHDVIIGVRVCVYWGKVCYNTIGWDLDSYSIYLFIVIPFYYYL